jgi:hypothetical protein
VCITTSDSLLSPFSHQGNTQMFAELKQTLFSSFGFFALDKLWNCKFSACNYFILTLMT